jgi:hypothetical protein
MAAAYDTTTVIVEDMCHDMQIDTDREKGAIKIRKLAEP